MTVLKGSIMKVPGGLILRNGRYTYKVTYPGHSKPTRTALKVPGQKNATKNKDIAEQLAVIMYNKHMANDPVDVFDGTIEDLCKRYLAYAKRYHTDSDRKVATYYTTKVYSLKLLREICGNEMAANFGSKKLMVFREKMIRLKELQDMHIELDDKNLPKGKRKKLQSEYDDLQKNIGIKGVNRPVCRREINRRIGIIKAAWQWATCEEMLPESSYHALLSVKGIMEGKLETYDHEDVKPVEHDIVEITLNYCNKVIADMITVENLTGMRPGELCRMTPAKIDRSVDPWLYTCKAKMDYKGKKRRIYLGHKAQAILSPYLLRSPDAPIFSPKESEQLRRAAKHAKRVIPIHLGNKPGTNRKENPMCRPGDMYTPGSYYSAISRAIKRAQKEHPELPHWFPYQLRHSHGTKVGDEFGIEAASASLGNDIPSAKVYAERNDGLAIAAAKRFG